MTYSAAELEAANRALAAVVDGTGTVADLFLAAGCIVPTTAAFCVVNRAGQAPIYLGDTYPDGPAKAAVQLYVSSTYLLNPAYNAMLGGLGSGVHRMADLAPDNWNPDPNSEQVLQEDDEEIGYRTPGWPEGLQELVMLVELGDGAMGEISLARPAADGGYSIALRDRLGPFLPLFRSAFQHLWQRLPGRSPAERSTRELRDFGREQLTPREAEIVQLILKGHSSHSISLTLGIALPTVKSHRKNAYAKLGISTQQQLFNAFLTWQADGV